MMSIERIRASLLESAETKKRVAEVCAEPIARGAQAMIAALKDGKKILLCGNGGSAADAQHLAAELIGRFKKERRALPAIALTTDTSVITCLSNDYSYDTIFSRQIEGLGQKGDVLVAISTSGRSANVNLAVKQAKKQGLYTIGLTGKSGGELRELVDCAIHVPAEETARIQECQLTIGHILCEIIDDIDFES